MRYQEVVGGTFISRPNRFIARVLIDGREHTVHVKNTGRCRELLTPGAHVILEHHADYREMGRKTEYSLTAVYKGGMLVNMDSQAPNLAAEEWLRGGGLAGCWRSLAGMVPGMKTDTDGPAAEPAGGLDACAVPVISDIRREVRYGSSRFDLAFTVTMAGGGRRSARMPEAEISGLQICSRPAFMEVKGVTLEQNGAAMFPDAPTQRGVKHLLELTEAVRHGYMAFILFVIQMKGVAYFTPNRETHEEFARALQASAEQGVRVLALECRVQEDGFEIDQPVPVRW